MSNDNSLGTLRPEQLFRLEQLRRDLEGCDDLVALRAHALNLARLLEMTRNAWEELR
jgi:hypothetical protein